MDLIQIEAKKREATRKKACKKYRKEGMIPSVIYGQKDNVNILVNQKMFDKIFNKITRSTLINLNVDDKIYEVIIKDYERDYLNDIFVHVDFYELDKTKPVRFFIPFNFTGNPIGVREGGILVKQLTNVEIICFPKDVVPHIDVNIEHLMVNDSLHISDITFDSKFKVLSSLQDVVVHVSGKKAEEEEVAKPEVEAEVGAEGEAGVVTGEEAEKTEEGEKKEKDKDKDKQDKDKKEKKDKKE